MSTHNVVETLKKYIREVLGFKINPKLWVSDINLPIFLKNNYDVYSVFFLNKSCILAVAKDGEESTPAQVSKHMKCLEEKTGKCCIYVAECLPTYNRQRFISHQVRFVIPGIQMYLPDLGIDCRKTPTKKSVISPTFSPAAQTVIIYALIHGCNKQFIPSELAEKLGYTRMTMTRVLNELEARRLGKTERIGKKRYFYFQIKRESFWKRVLSFMKTPVKESLWIQVRKPTFEKIKKLGFIAGLTALSQKSIISPPAYPVFALFQDEWKALLESEKIQILPTPENVSMQVEIWNYDPDLFDKDQVVDPFSLYLSLKDEKDERVEKALAKLMEKIEW